MIFFIKWPVQQEIWHFELALESWVFDFSDLCPKFTLPQGHELEISRGFFESRRLICTRLWFLIWSCNKTSIHLKGYHNRHRSSCLYGNIMGENCLKTGKISQIFANFTKNFIGYRLEEVGFKPTKIKSHSSFLPW